MQLSRNDFDGINQEVIAKLKELIGQIETDGVQSLGIDFDHLEPETLLDGSVECFANGDILGGLVLSLMDSMDGDYSSGLDD